MGYAIEEERLKNPDVVESLKMKHAPNPKPKTRAGLLKDLPAWMEWESKVQPNHREIKKIRTLTSNEVETIRRAFVDTYEESDEFPYIALWNTMIKEKITADDVRMGLWPPKGNNWNITEFFRHFTNCNWYSIEYISIY